MQDIVGEQFSGCDFDDGSFHSPLELAKPSADSAARCSLPIDSVILQFLAWLSAAPYSCFERADGVILLFKQARRGSGRYVRKLTYRFESFVYSIPDIAFFDAYDKLQSWKQLRARREAHRFLCKTPMFWAVRTFNHDKVSMHESWHQSEANNLYISNLKRVLSRYFGHPVRVQRIIIPEAHHAPDSRGYAHYNDILLFSEFIPVFPYITIDKFGHEVVTWRIRDKRLWESLKGCWPSGFMDIQALCSIRKGYTTHRNHPVQNGSLSLLYLVKYLLKSIDSPAAQERYPVTLMTYSIEWFHGSRAFGSLPDSFIQSLKQLVAARPFDLINNMDVYPTKTESSISLVVRTPELVYVGHFHKLSDVPYPQFFDCIKESIRSRHADEAFRSCCCSGGIVLANLQRAAYEDSIAKLAFLQEKKDIKQLRKLIHRSVMSYVAEHPSSFPSSEPVLTLCGSSSQFWESYNSYIIEVQSSHVQK